MPKFVVTSGPHAGLEIEMAEGQLVFGRSEECDVIVPEPEVSRIHAQALNLNGTVVLYDLESANGTYVNGVPISRAYLMDGDEIRIGSTVFRFESSSHASVGAPVASKSATLSQTEASLVNREGEASLDNNTRLLKVEMPPVSPEMLKEMYLRLKMLFRVSLAVSESNSLREMVEALAQGCVIALGIERIASYQHAKEVESWEQLFERLSNTAKQREGELPALDLHLLEECCERREPLFWRWMDGKMSPVAEPAQASGAAFPCCGSTQTALIVVDNPVSRKSLSKDDTDLLTMLARQIQVRLGQIDQLVSLRNENITLRQRYREDVAIITINDRMKRVKELTLRAAERDCTVLITGETGTGKELIARWLHIYSPRHQKPFVPVNCAALPDTLLESELFGHEKGAFTGASERRIGKFELADGGTLFLDEIGDISPSAQAKLLRVLQEGEIQRLGSNKIIKVNVRVVAATNKKLEEEVKAGRFREDLFYRIRVLEIALPPLRERPEDIPILVNHFLEQLRREHPTQVRAISPEALQYLRRYSFPGNVRELRNIIERALVLASGDTILPEHLPTEVIECGEPLPVSIGREPQTTEVTSEFQPRSLAAIERDYICRVLEHVHGNKVKAAEILGISRTTLYEKLKEYGLGPSSGSISETTGN